MSGAERVGVFGGSFNPPHVAHVLAVTYALLVAPIDRVLVVPVYRHPFSKELVSYQDRLAMCELAFRDLARVSVSTIERELGGESLTLKTLEALAQENPSRKLRLILGSDVVEDLPKWHRFDRISEIAEPFIIERRGVTSRHDRALLPELSSTEVRGMLERGDLVGLESLVPRAVLEYASQRGLYARAR